MKITRFEKRTELVPDEGMWIVNDDYTVITDTLVSLSNKVDKVENYHEIPDAEAQTIIKKQAEELAKEMMNK